MWWWQSRMHDGYNPECVTVQNAWWWQSRMCDGDYPECMMMMIQNAWWWWSRMHDDGDPECVVMMIQNVMMIVQNACWLQSRMHDDNNPKWWSIYTFTMSDIWLPQCLTDLFLAGVGVESKVTHLWMTLTHSCLAHRHTLMTMAASDGPISPMPVVQCRWL